MTEPEPARGEGEVNESGAVLKWRCGTCDQVLAAPDLETLRAAVREHIGAARRRGVTEPRCGYCGEPMSEDAASVSRHTNYFDDVDPTIGPRCGYMRLMERLVL